MSSITFLYTYYVVMHFDVKFILRSFSRKQPQCYALQEEFVADQLFQSSEHFPDDLLWITQSVLSSVKVTSC